MGCRAGLVAWLVVLVGCAESAPVLTVQGGPSDRAASGKADNARDAGPPEVGEPDARAPEADERLARPPTVVSSGGRIVAIGDVHGDLEQARKALQLAEVVDETGHWIGGHTVAVQVGDQVDRGDDDRAVLDWFEALSVEARAAGGAFYPLIGNHEQMNAQLDFRYVTTAAFKSFAGVPVDPSDARVASVAARKRGRAAAFVPGGPYARLLSAHNVIQIVDTTIFVHGGVLPHHVAEGLDALNDEHSAWLRGDGRLSDLWGGDDSPVWDRTFSEETTAAGCALLYETLDALGLSRMVVAHTPQEDGITTDCNDRVIRVDVGLSTYYGGPVQALEILGDEAWILY